MDSTPIRSFAALTARLSRSARRVCVAVAGEADAVTVEAVFQAIEQGFVEAVFVGEATNVVAHPSYANLSRFIRLLPAKGEDEAAGRAVALVREGVADLLMKGLLHTDNLLHAVLNKQGGLLPQGSVLTHLTVAEIPGFDRLLVYGDVAVIPEPNAEQRLAQVRYMDKLLRLLGINAPRIALVHFSEKVSPKFPLTTDYRTLSRQSAAGLWGTTIIDGPLDVRTAVDPVALRTKGINSPIAGLADGLIMPNLEAGNTLYKTLTFFAHARQAGLLQGTTHPVVLTSRGDEAETKYLSLATAALNILMTS